MGRFLIVSFIGLSLLGCRKESDSEVADPGERSQERRSSGNSESQRSGDSAGPPSSPKNSYAEKNWPVEEEVENEWTEEFKQATTPEAKIAVVERKQSSGPELLAPLIRLSLREPDEFVRTEAVKTITSFADGISAGRGGLPRRAPEGRGDPGDEEEPEEGNKPEGSDEQNDQENPDEAEPEVVDLVLGAAHDPSSEVRILAMEAALELPVETQLRIYRRTISVPDEGVRRLTTTELGRMLSKPAFEVLITGLRNEDEAFRREVNTEIRILVNRTFESYGEADSWWSENADRFSEKMVSFD